MTDQEVIAPDQYPISASATQVAMLIGRPTAAMAIEYSEIFKPLRIIVLPLSDEPLFSRNRLRRKVNWLLT